MSEKNCKCKEIKDLAKMLAEYLNSAQQCALKGDKLLEKDHKDIKELLKRADNLLK